MVSVLSVFCGLALHRVVIGVFWSWRKGESVPLGRQVSLQVYANGGSKAVLRLRESISTNSPVLLKHSASPVW
jgi:hypothetical protein